MLDSLKFNNKLKNILKKENIDDCTKFDQKFLEVLDRYAPLKKKLLRGNHALHVFLFFVTKSNNEKILPGKLSLKKPHRKLTKCLQKA